MIISLNILLLNILPNNTSRGNAESLPLSYAKLVTGLKKAVNYALYSSPSTMAATLSILKLIFAWVLFYRNLNKPVICFMRERGCKREPGDVFVASLWDSGDPFNWGDVFVSLDRADRRRMGPESRSNKGRCSRVRFECNYVLSVVVSS